MPNVPGETRNWLYDVDAISQDDVWAVGQYADAGDYHGPLAEHWDGSAWSIVEIPYDPAISYNLTGVSGVSSDDVWIVGEENPGSGFHPYFIHWDGTAWSQFPVVDTDEGGEIFAVHMIAADDGWAAGPPFRVEPQLASIPWMLHWDGASWTTVEAPSDKDSNALGAVAASGSGDVWAVGQRDDLYTAEYPINSLNEHRDGSAWSQVIMDDPGAWNVLTDVEAPAANAAWAVGSFYDPDVYPPTEPALIFRWDGSSWTRDLVPSVNTSEVDDLTEIYAANGSDVWGVGTHSVWADGTDVKQTLPMHCSVDPDLDGIVGPADNCPAWYNPTQALPSWPVPAGDADCDGFSTTVENSVGTDPVAHCGADAWPADINSDGSSDITDISALAGNFGESVPPAPVRQDIAPDPPDGFVDIADIAKLAGFFGKSCA